MKRSGEPIISFVPMSKSNGRLLTSTRICASGSPVGSSGRRTVTKRASSDAAWPSNFGSSSMWPDNSGAMASAAALALVVLEDAAAAEPETEADIDPEAADDAGAKRPNRSGANDSPLRIRSMRSRRNCASCAAAILPCASISSLRARRPAWPEIR